MLTRLKANLEVRDYGKINDYLQLHGDDAVSFYCDNNNSRLEDTLVDYVVDKAKTMIVMVFGMKGRVKKF